MLPVREDSRDDWSARSLSLEDHRSCALSALSDHIPISGFERNSTNTALKKKKKIHHGQIDLIILNV